MDLAILDTDTLTEVFKRRNPTVLGHAKDYLTLHGEFAISAMTRFEILRGLRHKRASAKLAEFESLCRQMLVLPIADSVIDRAADLWVAARDGGYPQRDADRLIAATALVNNRELITGNTAHYRWISALKLRDWRQP